MPHLRVHELEEMVKDQETTAEQALEEEAQRHREVYCKLEREKSTELELLNTRWAPGLLPAAPLMPLGPGVVLPPSVPGKAEPAILAFLLQIL